MKKFSIVIPVYFEEINILPLLERLRQVASQLKQYEVEFVFVDDGSTDKTVPLLLAERQKDARVKVVKLSRNFGSYVAIQAGFSVATGDCVGVITADLQDPPELFVDMIAHWEKGKKVVLVVRSDRKESFFQKLFAGIYYRMMSRYVLTGYPEGGFDFVLLDRQVVTELNRMPENTNTMSLIFWLGYERAIIPYVRQKRERGVSHWTFSKKVKLFIDSFISFSYVPIRFISLVGIVTAVSSFLYGLFVVINYIFGTIPVQGYTTLVVIITFLLGLIMVMLGIIGEYLWRVLDQSRKRPIFIIDQVFQ